jgi:L-ascorbate metabolism protein UlaG (beta-lactamase superfamily)
MVSLRWFGHAAVELDFGNKKVIIDPLIKDNPKSPVKLEELIGKYDIVAVTHDHYDHLGDAVEILKGKGHFFANFDLAVHVTQTMNLPMEKVIQANVGGYIEFNGLKLALTKAVHSSEHGDPTGVVVSGDGITIYHAGDTGLFEDMKLIGQVFKPDYVLLPIGGRFTMDPEQASMAVDMLKPKKAAIPIHYNTWPLIQVNESQFAKLNEAKGYKTIMPKLGEKVQL